MRTLILLPAVLLGHILQAQVAVRSYYDTFTNAGPQLERTTPLANGDVLYYDQGWNGLARLAPDGSVVWYKRFAIDPDPLAFTAIAHAAEQDNSTLVLAIVQRDPDGTYHPGSMHLGFGGDLLSARVNFDLEVGVLDWVRVFVAQGPGGNNYRISLRGTGNGGSLHSFTSAGTWVQSEDYFGGADVPVEGLMQGTSLIGATLGRLQRYGTPGWALAPGLTTIAGVNYSATIWDVAPVPGGFAFAFLRLGGPELMMPGIGLVDQNGVFQNAIVFQVDALMGMTNLFDRPRLASTTDGLALACNNGSLNDPKGWLMTCAHDLSDPQVLRVDLGDESYARSVSAWSGDLVLTGYVDQFGVGERLIARTSNNLDMSDCFPSEPFTVQPFPMQTASITPVGGTPVTTTWTPVSPTVTDATFSSDFLCGVQSVNDGGPGFQFTLFPNPASSEVRLDWPNDGPVHLRLCDALGRTVRQQQLINCQTPISLQGLAPGMYQLQVVQDGVGRTLPLVVR